MKAPYRVVRCPVCQRKRHARILRTDYDYEYWIDSKDHEWKREFLDTEKADRMLRAIYEPLIHEMVNTRTPLIECFR